MTLKRLNYLWLSFMTIAAAGMCLVVVAGIDWLATESLTSLRYMLAGWAAVVVSYIAYNIMLREYDARGRKPMESTAQK